MIGKRLQSFKQYFLANLRDESYVIQEKAYIHFWVSVIFIILLFCVIIYNTLNPSDMTPYINMVNGLLALTTLAALFIVRSGRYEKGTAIMIAAFTLLWIAGTLFKMERYMVSGTNSFLYFMFPLMIIVSMFGTRAALIAVTVAIALLNSFFLIGAGFTAEPAVFSNIAMSSVNIYISITIVCAFSYLVSSITSRALEKVEQELEEKRRLNQGLELRVEERTREIEAALDELESMNESLIAANRDLASAQKIMELDMNMAVNVQQSFLPKEPPRVRDWDIAFAFRPMSGVSGDFYDFYTEGGHLKGLSLFDVSGHGIASGLVTMIAKSIVFRNFVKSGKGDLNGIMSRINSDLLEEMANVENYLTGIVLRFNGNSVEYVNAAHTDLVLRRAASGRAEEIVENDGDNRGAILSMASLAMEYPLCRFTVEAGDVLVLYSDCLNESFGPDGDQYGTRRILESIEKTPLPARADSYCAAIMQGLDEFMAGRSLADDLTLIVLKKLE
jgi:sigma-B regulation protein RsbU (phosphoserine phosphatase)